MHCRWWFGIVAIAGLLLFGPAGAADCADDLAGTTAGMTVTARFDAYAACVAELSARLDAMAGLQASVDQALADLQALRPIPDVPSGAVVAFDTTGRCPEGWSPFAAVQGRFLVGASFGLDPEPGLGTNEAGEPLVEYKYRDHGGVEAVALTAAQMPAHSHTVTQRRTTGIGGTHGLAAAADVGEQATKTTSAGNGRPHTNMPPYLALHFCKKH